VPALPIEQRAEHTGREQRSASATQAACLTCKATLAYHLPVSDVFEALAAPARRAILDELHDRDGQTLFELCTRLTMRHGLQLSRQAISQHLDVLEAAGLVVTSREGRYKFHFIDLKPLKAVMERWRGKKGDGQR
jgi:DNA-binding transcriptional ArsR family regulator